jgi:hypothetical protein
VISREVLHFMQYPAIAAVVLGVAAALAIVVGVPPRLILVHDSSRDAQLIGWYVPP